nr:MAG TPA: hypothetical protein [Caudoviricetes sp.]
MAVCLINKSGGGVSSDDVTAKREHVLQGYTALTSDSNDEPVQGTIPNRGNGTNVLELINSAGESKLYARMDEGFYSKNGQYKPAVAIPYAVLAQSIGINASKILDDYTVAGTRGAIPRWIATHGDVIIANQSHSGQGFAYDLPNVGRCIVTGIKNGACIQGANYVALPSPNFLPHNIRKGVNINGIVGTMPDYSTGRVVFNGATFDNELVSGVADKPFFIVNDYYANYISNEYRYSGIWGGGMNFSLTTFSSALLGRKIGCVLSQSVDLSPFSRIAINYNLSGTVKNNPNVNLECFVSPLRSLKRAGKMVQGVGNIDGFSEAKAVVRAGSVTINRQGQLTLDVSNINEQAFLILTASITVANSSESFSGALQITKIEFFN